MIRNCFLILCTVFHVLLYSQSNFSIKGRVVNNQQQNVPNAVVTIKTETKLLQTQTDTLGYFKATIPAGNVLFDVSKLGYLQKSINYNIKADDDSIIIVLEKDIQTLNEVKIVTNSSKAITTQTDNVLKFNPNKLNSIPSLSGSVDIIKILQLTPGVQNSGDANGYLYVRGGDPGHNAMLYENVPIYGMSHLLGIFPFYNASHIAEVVFDKSSNNPKYGNRLGATIQALSHNDIPNKSSIKGNIGLLASQFTISTPLSSKVALYLSGRKTYIDEIIAPLFKEKNSQQDFKYGFYDGNFTLVAKPLDTHTFKLDAFISNDSFKINDTSLSLNTKLKWSNISFTPSWKIQLSNTTWLTNTLYFSKYTNQLDFSQSDVDMNITSSIQDFGYLSSLKYTFKGIEFDSGIQFVSHQLKPQAVQVFNLGIDNIDSSNTTIYAKQIGAYTSGNIKLTSKLNFDVGLRFNYYSSANLPARLHLEPRVLFNYLLQNSSFYASYTRKNQYINLITTSSVGIPTDFWIATSEGIPSQSANEFAVGFNQNFKQKYTINTSVFYRNMNRLMEYPYGITQFNQTTSLQNDLLIGKGNAYGLETMLRKEEGKFKGWLSYTLSYATRQFDGLNNGNMFYAKYDRRHNLSLTANYNFNEHWNIGMTQIFSSGNRFTMPTSWYFINNNPVKEYSNYNNAQIKNYVRTDFLIQYWFFKTNKRESGISFSVYNTFKIKNPIYVNLKVNSNNDDSIAVEVKEQTLYTILPSINWLFKF